LDQESRLVFEQLYWMKSQLACEADTQGPDTEVAV
jgi:hypothetical protein